MQHVAWQISMRGVATREARERPNTAPALLSHERPHQQGCSALPQVMGGRQGYSSLGVQMQRLQRPWAIECSAQAVQ